MKIGIITDIHYGRDGYFGTQLRRIFRHTDELLEKFVIEMNQRVRPDIVVQLGDLIEDTDRETDLRNLGRVAQYFASLQAPVIHVLGNHDRRDLTRSDFCNVLGDRCFREFVSFDKVNLCFVDSELDGVVPFFTESALSNIQRLGADSQRPTIFFSHHPIAEYDIKANPNWSPTNVHKAFPSNRETACSLIQSLPGTIVSVNGHLHANYKVESKGLGFVTVQSLVDNFRNDGTPAGAYGVLEVGPTRSQIEVFGNDPAVFTVERGLANVFSGARSN